MVAIFSEIFLLEGPIDIFDMDHGGHHGEALHDEHLEEAAHDDHHDEEKSEGINCALYSRGMADFSKIKLSYSEGHLYKNDFIYEIGL